MGFFSLLGVLSPAHISLFTATSGGKKIGTDQLGNKYYEAKARKGYKRTRRWVIYKGAPEASLVPPEWHGWLHHQTNVVPTETNSSFRRPWQKPHQANQTGTPGAYMPAGSLYRAAPAVRSDYDAWRPK